MKIGIIGLGLMGGSILKSLREHDYEIYAVTRNGETLTKVKNYVKNCSSDILILKNCDVIFVCTPISKILETLDNLENVADKNCIVTDVASVKSFVTKKKRPYKFIPSHPMAGTENSGYDASIRELFEGAKWVLTPYDCKETDILTNLIEKMGATPVITTPQEHDEAVALISHLPMYIAQSLFHLASGNKLAMSLASSGFRDTTRLAMTDETLAKDMMHFNQQHIEKSVYDFISELNTLQSEYPQELDGIRKKRRRMYSESGKNILED